MNQNLYIDRDTSSVIKGVLIILIVMGHNKVLCSTDNKGADYLYLFHVICFFILPFFYDTKNGHSQFLSSIPRQSFHLPVIMEASAS